MAREVAPISVEPSGDFLGDDGQWSVLNIQVGRPPQHLKVLASTQIPETWLVDPQGCNNKDLSNCTKARGGEYKWVESSAWEKHGNAALEAESNLGMTENSDVGNYGYDVLGIGRPGNGNVTLTKLQVVATVATKDFFVGSVGLAARRVSTAEMGQPPGLLASLNDEKLIPSLSYGYTAGAAYRKSNASLTLGGFDRSKFTPNDINFPLASPETRELVVGLQSIISTEAKGNETSLLVKKIPMLLDSTVPHIWLPVDTCQKFERAFGFTYDPISNFYYIDDDLHDQLTKKNASITFTLAVSETGGPEINITLPYASFDLYVTPYHYKVKRASKYFPLRQAHDESQYTLGRTFFQESYLIVDYESRNFSISQSVHTPDDSSNVIAIASAPATVSGTEPTGPGSESTPPITTVTPKPQKSRALATPAVAGIVSAIAVLALLAAGILLYFRIRKRKARARRLQAELASDPPLPRDTPELDGSGNPNPQKGGPGVTVEEKEQAQMDQTELLLMNQANAGGHGPIIELASPDLFRPELPNQEPYHRFELPSPEPGLRSELSTPEPIVRSELSTPEPGWPASSELGDTTVGEPSPPLDGVPSPVSAPGSFYSGNRRREPHRRMDSSESEGGWHQTGTPPRSRPSLRHSRMISSESESSFQANRAPSDSSRPTQIRMDSTDSESGVIHANSNSVRAPHRRLDSTDSVITMETRLALISPAISPAISFFPPRPNQDRPQAQGLPSLRPDPSLLRQSSPSLESMRSGLLSPSPLENVEEGEPRDFREIGARSGSRPRRKEVGSG